MNHDCCCHCSCVELQRRKDLTEIAILQAKINGFNRSIRVQQDHTRDIRLAGNVNGYQLAAAELANLRARRVELHTRKMKLEAQL